MSGEKGLSEGWTRALLGGIQNQSMAVGTKKSRVLKLRMGIWMAG